MGKFQSLKKECPICAGAGKRCTQSLDFDITKYTTGLVFCADKSAFSEDWRFLHPDPHTGFYIWAKKDSRVNQDDKSQKKFRWLQQQNKQKEARKLNIKIKNSLSPTERDREIRKIVSQLSLSDYHRQILSDRGLTDKQIAENGYRSVRKWQKLVHSIDTRLAGLDRSGNKLNNGVSGILCPVKNEDGLFVGSRINNLSDRESGKYQWVSSSYRDVDNKIYVNEVFEDPIAVHYPDDYQVKSQKSKVKSIKSLLPSAVCPLPSKIGICEGMEYKAAIAANKLGFPVIGVSGCNFHLSINLLKQAINSINPDAEIVFIPDAGANPFVANSYKNALIAFGFLKDEDLPEEEQKQPLFSKLSVAWWNQWYKTDGDIDEIGDDTEIKLISIEKFNKKILERQQSKEFQQWAERRIFTPDIVLNQKYFEAATPEKNTIAFIKAPLGSGKTTQLNKWIKGLEYQKGRKTEQFGFIALGYRNSLLFQFCAQTGFNHIHEKDSAIERDNPYSQIALCVDSLLKFQPEDFDNKIIIIDEVVSVLKHLTSSKTIRTNKRRKIIRLFEEAIKRANRVICLDGHLSDYIVDYFVNICDKKVVRIENQYKQKRELYLYGGSVTNRGNINKRDKSGIIKKITESSKPVIATDSQTFAETIDELLTTKDYNNCRIDSTTTGEPWAKEFLADCDRFIEENKPDSLIYSPSAESGLSVDTKDYFSDKFVFAHGVLDTNSVLQISKRVRDEIPLHLWANSSPRVSKNQIKAKEVVDKFENYIKTNFDFASADNLEIQKTADWVAYQLKEATNPDEPINKLIKIFNEIEAYEKQGDNYKFCLSFCFTRSGYKVIEVNPESDKETNDEFKESREIVLRSKASSIFNALDIDPEQLNQPLSFNSTQQDKFAREKAYIKKSLPGVTDTEIWNEEFIYHLKYKNPDFLKQINNYVLLKYPSLIECLQDKSMRFLVGRIMNNEDISLWDLKQQNSIIQGLKELGIQRLLDNPEDNYTYKHPVIKEIHLALRRRKTLRQKLDFADQVAEKYAIRNVNRCLNFIGYSLKAKPVRINNVPTRVYHVVNDNSKAIDYFNPCLKATESKWQTWAQAEKEKLEAQIEELSKNPDSSKLVQMANLIGLYRVSDSLNIINNSTAKSDYIIQESENREVTRGRFEFLLRKLKRKTFIEGIKISESDRKMRDWIQSEPQAALKELLAWVNSSYEGFEQTIDMYGNVLKFEIFAILNQWLPNS